MMTTTEKSILATVAYFDVLNIPLRIEEIFGSLICPKRFDPGFSGRIKFQDVLAALSDISQKPLGAHISEGEGFYFIHGREEIVALRQERRKISILKWKKTRPAIKMLAHVPYVRMVMLGGSVAQDNAKDSSDIDILVVARHGRIWTCRIFVTLLLSIFGIRRSDRGQMTHELVKDKICLNHYITDRSLHIPFHSLYNAQSYSQLIPVIEKEKGLFERFQKENLWAADYVCSFPKDRGLNHKILYKDKIGAGSRLAEFVFDITIAGLLELAAKKYQKRRIAKNIPKNLNMGRIIFDDMQLEFHPNSPEAAIIDKYNFLMSKLKLEGYSPEKNSGLK
jgi:predicted nucleotidyltransferase